MANMEHERVVGEWRRSLWTWGFWWRTIVTLGMYALLLWHRNVITLTTRRVHQRRGNILGGEETTISLDNITDISLDTPALGALFDYGNITIQSAGSTQAEIRFKGLGDANGLRDAIYDVKDGRLDEVNR